MNKLVKGKQVSGRLSDESYKEFEKIKSEHMLKTTATTIEFLVKFYQDGKRAKEESDRLVPVGAETNFLENEDRSLALLKSFEKITCSARLFYKDEAFCKLVRGKKPRKLFGLAECKACYRLIKIRSPLPTITKGEHYMTQKTQKNFGGNRGWKIP